MVFTTFNILFNIHQPGQKCERQQVQDEGAGLDFHHQGRLHRRVLPVHQIGPAPTFKKLIWKSEIKFDLSLLQENLENWQFPVHLIQLRNFPHPYFYSPVLSATKGK